MPRKAWTVTVEGKDHPVELKWGNFLGDLKVKVDGAVVYSQDISFGGSNETVSFEVAGVLAVMMTGFLVYEVEALPWGEISGPVTEPARVG